MKVARFYVEPDEKVLWASMSTLLTLSYVCDEAEKDLLRTVKPVASSMVDHLKNALREGTHTHGGWSAVELVSGMANLTELDENIPVFVSCGLVRHLVKMLDVGNDHEIEHASDLVWKLMQDDNKQTIMETKGLSEQLEQMKYSSNGFVKQAVIRIKTRVGLNLKQSRFSQKIYILNKHKPRP